ncbi:hypothetical protein HOY80DRAFT_1045481 [Tuber brumale]|nr:hypothetical protein HOY80DRAFT_1045481 [Tuber brumale]
MIYLIYADYKAKVNKLVEVVDSCKLEIDELKATQCPDIPTPIPFNLIGAKVPELSTAPTTYPPPVALSLNTAIPSWAIMAKKGRKKSSTHNNLKASVMGKAPTTTPKTPSRKGSNARKCRHLIKIVAVQPQSSKACLLTFVGTHPECLTAQHNLTA